MEETVFSIFGVLKKLKNGILTEGSTLQYVDHR
jgi:hypothetical protein